MSVILASTTTAQARAFWSGGKGIAISANDDALTPSTHHVSVARVVSYDNGESGLRGYGQSRDVAVAHATFMSSSDRDGFSEAGLLLIQNSENYTIRNVLSTGHDEVNLVHNNTVDRVSMRYNLIYRHALGTLPKTSIRTF